ncbi:hypothetical protein AMECASPLE_005167 [Ameca splendens]|uniref:Uncharacterized protein n=1 Tax=Ameca splendens TaxID=208324 RepID=A0ABV0XC39_9TELE
MSFEIIKWVFDNLLQCLPNYSCPMNLFTDCHVTATNFPAVYWEFIMIDQQTVMIQACLCFCLLHVDSFSHLSCIQVPVFCRFMLGSPLLSPWVLCFFHTCKFIIHFLKMYPSTMHLLIAALVLHNCKL